MKRNSVVSHSFNKCLLNACYVPGMVHKKRYLSIHGAYMQARSGDDSGGQTITRFLNKIYSVR